jgi:hypothetical protein
MKRCSLRVNPRDHQVGERYGRLPDRETHFDRFLIIGNKFHYRHMIYSNYFMVFLQNTMPYWGDAAFLRYT